MYAPVECADVGGQKPQLLGAEVLAIWHSTQRKSIVHVPGAGERRHACWGGVRAWSPAARMRRSGRGSALLPGTEQASLVRPVSVKARTRLLGPARCMATCSRQGQAGAVWSAP